ncbi:hypothetical protein HK099_005031, partial [Clydaea vesicula]
NVSKDLVIAILKNEFNITVNENFVETDESDVNLKKKQNFDLPPAYNESENINLIISSRLNYLIDEYLLNLINTKIKRGLKRFRLILSNIPNLNFSKIATNVEHFDFNSSSSSSSDSSSGPFDFDFFSLNPSFNEIDFSQKGVDCTKLPDLDLLFQLEVLNSFANLIVKRTGSKHVSVEKKEIMIRSANEFGLIESKEVPVLFLAIEIL